MKLKDLNRLYDQLQMKYGAKELHSIYNGGCENAPEICFVFMNPTGRNIASLKNWKGCYSPWIGSKNIWKIFYQLGLLDDEIWNEIRKRKGKEWTEELADMVYNNVKKHKYFITNLGKCTQIDARPLPDSVYREYLDLLYQEIDIIKPKKIITFGNQVSTIFLGQTINVSKCRKQVFYKKIGKFEYPIYPTYYPVGNGMRNMDIAILDLSSVLKKDEVKTS